MIFSKNEQQRIEKVRGRSLRSFSVMKSYLTLPFRKKTAVGVYPMFYVIIKDFFLIQFLEKWRIIKIPVVHVDHPLDQKVPFTPERVGIYFDFINVWIRPLSMLLTRFPAKKGLTLCREWIDRLRKTYKESARFYHFCLSTTDRPKYKKSAAFIKIHLLDPHFCCVPSLHIAIVVLVFSFYRELFERENFSTEEKSQWNAELYADAVSIAETVLYVKQHSVNCIPAALYMMTKIHSDIITTDDCLKFIDDLFRNQSDINADDKAAIHAHIHYMYERFYLEGLHYEDWREPVQRWITEYEAEHLEQQR